MLTGGSPAVSVEEVAASIPPGSAIGIDVTSVLLKTWYTHSALRFLCFTISTLKTLGCACSCPGVMYFAFCAATALCRSEAPFERDDPRGVQRVDDGLYDFLRGHSESLKRVR
jgi:hypothetical protein